MFVQGLFEGLINGSILALIAMGVALVWGVMNILSFSQGEFLMLGMYVTFFLNMILGLDPILSLPLAFVSLFILGWIIYKTIIKRAIKGPTLSQRLVTFSLSMILINAALLMFTSEFKIIPKVAVTGSFNIGSLIVAKQKLVPLIIALIIAGSMFAFLQYTRIGKAIRATAMNRNAASLVGIDTELMYALSFSLAAAVAGSAGCALTYFYYMFPTVGANFQLWAFIAVAMGGIGSIEGAFISGLIMGIADTVTGIYVNPAIKYIGVCIVFLVIVSFKPKGIFGK